MLSGVSNEALKRIAAARAVLRLVGSLEQGPAQGDVATRSTKGMLFVHNYAVYEYVVIESVRALVGTVNSRGLVCASTRTELLAMGLDAEFASIIDGSLKKTWYGRSTLLRRVRCSDQVRIPENLFPKDGSHYRPSQLETIWEIFGIPGPIVPTPRLRGHIEEMVDARNRIAHGTDAPDAVGGRFTVGDLEKRVDDTEAICTHIVSSMTTYAASPTAFH